MCLTGVCLGMLCLLCGILLGSAGVCITTGAFVLAGVFDKLPGITGGELAIPGGLSLDTGVLTETGGLGWTFYCIIYCIVGFKRTFLDLAWLSGLRSGSTPFCAPCTGGNFITAALVLLLVEP